MDTIQKKALKIATITELSSILLDLKKVLNMQHIDDDEDVLNSSEYNELVEMRKNIKFILINLRINWDD
jgi:hypothetical protein